MNMRDGLKVLAAGAALLAAAPALAQQGVATIGTNPPGTITNSAGSAIAKVMQETQGVEVRVQPFGGSGPLMSLVQQGKLDFAIVNVFEAGQAMRGGIPFTEAHPDLRVVASIFHTHVGFVVPKDSPIKTMADVKGKRVPAGYSSAPIIELMRKAMLANAGVTDDQIELVPVPNSVRGADLMQQGRVDLAFLSIGSGKVAEIDAAMGGVRFVPMSDAPKDVEALRKIMPQGSVMKLKAQKNFVGIEDGTGVLGYDQVLVANKNTSDKFVKAVIEVLTKQREALGETLPRFRNLTPEHMAGVPNTEYHATAIEAFKAMGVMK